ncbi:MAG: hypothetical protein NUV73_00600 [Candidatus Daviesbacteria bacterium]|nr:hypothetical protein [Candidatus Daviesbacteria bacterium]
MPIEIRTYKLYKGLSGIGEPVKISRPAAFEIIHFKHLTLLKTRYLVFPDNHLFTITAPVDLTKLTYQREPIRKKFLKQAITRARLILPGERPGEISRLYWRP